MRGYGIMRRRMRRAIDRAWGKHLYALEYYARSLTMTGNEYTDECDDDPFNPTWSRADAYYDALGDFRHWRRDRARQARQRYERRAIKSGLWQIPF